MTQFHSGDLKGVWFSSGASTDAGIAIGSTPDDLRAAYGTDLQGPEGGDYYVAAKGPPPRRHARLPPRRRDCDGNRVRGTARDRRPTGQPDLVLTRSRLACRPPARKTEVASR
jgi:hypothetical protein